MTCGITVAPTMPPASTRLSAPDRRGSNPPAALATREPVPSTWGKNGREKKAGPPATRPPTPRLPRAAHGQARQRGGPDDQAAEPQRQSEEQLQGDGPADDLGEVGHHHDGLRLGPQPPHD